MGVVPETQIVAPDPTLAGIPIGKSDQEKTSILPHTSATIMRKRKIQCASNLQGNSAQAVCLQLSWRSVFLGHDVYTSLRC